jgi:hypothetical protein
MCHLVTLVQTVLKFVFFFENAGQNAKMLFKKSEKMSRDTLANSPSLACHVLFEWPLTS